MTQTDTSRVLCPSYRRLLHPEACRWHREGGWGQEPDERCQGCKVAKTQEKEGKNETKRH